MDFCLSFNKPSVFFEPFPSAVKKPPIPSPRSFSGYGRLNLFGRRPTILAAAGGWRSNCDVGCSLNTPLEPKSLAGKILSGVLLDDFNYFHVAVGKQLQRLAAARDEAAARLSLSSGSDEATLHRRIAELREQECRIAIEDVLYMLVLYKFRDIRVHLIPKLSRCMYNGRLEILPSKDWELESIHSFEVLEMVKEHLTEVIGWRADSNVTANWAAIKVPRSHLCRIYTASVLYGHFLKSASMRHRLDLCLSKENCGLGITCHNPPQILQLFSCGLNDPACDCSNTTHSTLEGLDLRCYVMGFDPEILQICAKPRTKEAVNLIESHSCALFGDEKTGLVEKTGEVIVTSLSSLKRMVLEAVAFGSFLWDAEEFVGSVYKLQEN